jgi:hypothetical protein
LSFLLRQSMQNYLTASNLTFQYETRNPSPYRFLLWLTLR